MAGRLDPQHDRVILSPEEVRALYRLEEALAEVPPEQPEPAAKVAWSPNLRSRILMRLLGLGRYRPWLVPIGMVLMLATIGSSLWLSMAGVAVMALGLAACLGRPWLRAPVVHFRNRRRRRP
jgi:hypothetical protein